MKSYSSGEEKKSVTDIDTEKEAETVVNSQVLEAEVELPSRTKTLHSLSDQTRTEKLDREIENGLLDDCGDNDNDVLICRKMESVLDYDNLIGSGSTEAINHDHDRNDVIYSDEVDDASVNENSKEENSQEGNDGNGETEEKARMKLPKQLSIVRRGEESSDSASNNSTGTANVSLNVSNSTGTSESKESDNDNDNDSGSQYNNISEEHPQLPPKPQLQQLQYRHRSIERRGTSASNRNIDMNYQRNVHMNYQTPTNAYEYMQPQLLLRSGAYANGMPAMPTYTPTWIQQKVEGNYRMFAPVKASDDKTYQNFGDVQGESIAALDLIRKELGKYGLYMQDIVRVDVFLVNVQKLRIFDEVLASYFPDVKAPPRNVVGVNSLPDGCSVQIEVTCFNRMQFQELSPPQSKINYHYAPIPPDNISLGNGSQLGSPARRKQYYAPDSSMVSHHVNVNRDLEQNYDPMRRSTQLGDLLPPMLAMGYGYYGEMWERVLAGMKLLTIARFMVCIVSIVCFSLIYTSDWNADEERAELLGSSTIYFVLVANVVFAHAFLSSIYGLMWLYFNARCKTPGCLFDETVPDEFIDHHSTFIKCCAYGDFTFLTLTLSSCSALLPLIPIVAKRELDDNVTDKLVSNYLRGAAAFMFLLWFMLIFINKLSWTGLESFRTMGKRLPRCMQTVATTTASTTSPSQQPGYSSQPTTIGHPDHISESQTSYQGTLSQNAPVRY